MPSNKSELTADIVSAFVSHNQVAQRDLTELIRAIHAALTELENPSPPPTEKPVPAVSIKKSVTHDYLISLEDGRRYKSLKRHLGSRSLTPHQYREKWGLTADYPMVAPAYAQQRSELARTMGLGRSRKLVEDTPKAKAPKKPTPKTQPES